MRDEMDLVIVSIREKHYKITVFSDRYYGRGNYYVQEIREPIFVEDVSKMKKMPEEDMVNLVKYITGYLYNGDNDYDALFFGDPRDMYCSYPGDEVVNQIIDDLKTLL